MPIIKNHTGLIQNETEKKEQKSRKREEDDKNEDSIADMQMTDDQRNLWKLYEGHEGPMELEDGTWIMPSVELLTGKTFMDQGEIIWIFSEYFKKGLTYHYCVRGERTHEHTFDAVLYDAYYHASEFKILEEDTKEYSEQELKFLSEIVRRCGEAEGKGNL